MADYLVYLTISTGIFAMFALGLNVQWGFAGLINFGHVAFMTIGAYVTVLLTSTGYLQKLPGRMVANYGWIEQTAWLKDLLLGLGNLMPEQLPLLVAVIIGAIGASLLGLAIGTSTLRLREDYLAIVTIGVSELVRLMANNEQWLTQGAFGVQSYPLPLQGFNPSVFSKGIMIGLLTIISVYSLAKLLQKTRKNLNTVQGNTNRQNKLGTVIWAAIGTALILILYFNGVFSLANYSYKSGLMLILLVTLAVIYWGLESLVNSPWGRVLKAIREDEEIPRALGKNVFWYKLQAFMLGGVIAGIAGAFYAWQLTTVYPSSFETLVTFNAWTIVVLGGAGKNIGAVLGTIIFWGYDSLTRFGLPALVSLIDSNNGKFATFFDDARLGAFRIMVIGLILMVLMIWRPQGLLGNKDELSVN